MEQEFVWETQTGYVDSIDPVESHEETETEHVVDNGFNVYRVQKNEVIRWTIRRRPWPEPWKSPWKDTKRGGV